MQLAGEPLILRPTPRRCFETRSLPPDQFPLGLLPKQPGAALGRLEVDHADHQRASDRVSRIPPTPSSSAREGFGPFDTDHRGWCLVADVGRLLSTPASLPTAPTHTVPLPAPLPAPTPDP